MVLISQLESLLSLYNQVMVKIRVESGKQSRGNPFLHIRMYFVDRPCKNALCVVKN